MSLNCQLPAPNVDHSTTLQLYGCDRYKDTATNRARPAGRDASADTCGIAGSAWGRDVRVSGVVGYWVAGSVLNC